MLNSPQEYQVLMTSYLKGDFFLAPLQPKSLTALTELARLRLTCETILDSWQSRPLEERFEILQSLSQVISQFKQKNEPTINARIQAFKKALGGSVSSNWKTALLGVKLIPLAAPYFIPLKFDRHAKHASEQALKEKKQTFFNKLGFWEAKTTLQMGDDVAIAGLKLTRL